MLSNTWGRMTGGDKDAFLTLYQGHYQALFCYGFSLSADRELTKDCIQELFLEIWKTRPSLNKEVKNVRSYLFTWLRRKISRELSRLAKERSADEDMEEFPFLQLPYEELLIAFQQSEEKKEQLRAALEEAHGQTTGDHQAEILRESFVPQYRRPDLAHPPHGL